MSTEFTREERYIVFKVSDIERYLTDADRSHLAMMKHEIDAGRDCTNKPPFKGLIVEADWPEYEPTWKAIEARVTGAQAQPAPIVPNGWLRAINEDIGVVNADDTYEQARAKLDSLIGFHVDIATDPTMNGGRKLVPIEVVGLYNFMCAAFVPMTPQQEQIAVQLELAKQAMLTAAPEAKP